MFIYDYVKENIESINLDSSYTYFDSYNAWETARAYLDFYKIYKNDLDSNDFFKNQGEQQNQIKRAEILKKFLDLKVKEDVGIRLFSNGNFEKIVKNPAPSQKRLNAYLLPFCYLIDSYIKEQAWLYLNDLESAEIA